MQAGDRNRAQPKGRVVLAASVLLLVSLVVGSLSLEYIEGQLQMSSVVLVGSTALETGNLEAMHFRGSDTNGTFNGNWRVVADRISVNWTYKKLVGVGTAPGDPKAPFVGFPSPDTPSIRQGEDDFHDSLLSSTFKNEKSNFLIVSESPNSMSFNTTTIHTCEIDSTTGQIWSVGVEMDDLVQNADDANSFPLRASHNTTDDQPFARHDGGFQMSASGDFVLYVWGPNVTVGEPNDALRVYRSGHWWDNATGTELDPRGLVRDEHFQFLRLTVTNGTLEWVQDGGIAQWTAPRFESTTQGAVKFVDASGKLESDRFLYAVEQQTVRMGGIVEQTLGSHESTNMISTTITGSQATIDLPPAAPKSVTPSPSEDFHWFQIGGASVILLGLVVAATIWGRSVWRRHTLSDVSRGDGLAAAEQALIARRPKAAQRIAQRVLREAGRDPDAWFVYAASLVQQEKYEEVIEEVGPVAPTLSAADQAGFAYLLAFANARLDRLAEARRWLESAAASPIYLDQARKDPTLAPLLNSPAIRRVANLSGRDTSYA